MLCRRSLTEADRCARTAIVVKNYLYVIGGEQHDPNIEHGVAFGKPERFWV